MRESRIRFAIVASLSSLLLLIACPMTEAAIVTAPLVSHLGDDSGWDVTYETTEADVVVDMVNLESGFVVIEISKDFYPPQGPSLPTIGLDFSQRLSDGSTVSTIIIADEAITNLTGVDWTAFRWELLSEGNVWFDVVASGAFGIQPAPHFQTQTWQMTAPGKADVLTASDGLVANGTSYYPGVDDSDLVIQTNLDSDDSVSFALKQTPVPEPVSLAVLGLGLVATAWMRRMRR